MNHSLTKPFSGGRAVIPMTPMKQAPAVQGIVRASPPMRSRSWVPTRVTTDPAQRNIRLLNTA